MLKGFSGSPVPSESAIEGKAIEKILGHSGEANTGMFKVVIGRKAKMHQGGEVGKEMGVNTWAAFAGSNESGFVDGNFAVLESELQPVLKALPSFIRGRRPSKSSILIQSSLLAMRRFLNSSASRSAASARFRSVMSSESVRMNCGTFSNPGISETLLRTQIELPSLRRCWLSI